MQEGKPFITKANKGQPSMLPWGNSFVIGNCFRESGSDFNLESSTGQKI